MAPPVAAQPSVTKAAPAPFRPSQAEEKALVSPKALVARNFVASIVSELKRGRSGPAPPPPPPPPAATKPSLKARAPSKWAPVDTSAGLKRKWEPGNHVPSTIRSYVHLLSGGPVPHALGRMGSAN
ncbi:hypothetical protein AURDEDRAFT_112488 [Auricularia subglabra TFB-10046 SS5]|nr:hypothetical protein AURDEDRAFT_112488 [Auricularia subglabra TFB-10046 SS5]